MCTEQPATAANHTHRSSIESLQQDIGFANTFRLEKLKTMLAITTALLAFTVSFRPKLAPVESEWAMIAGWIGLSISLLAGIATIQAWEFFYISYRDYDWKQNPTGGKRFRKVVTRWRRVLFALQCAGFLMGVTGVGLFAAVNINHVQTSF